MKTQRKSVRQQTSEPGPEPVVVTVEEPVQDPGENCAVVDGGRGQAETRRDERGGEITGTPRRNNSVKPQDVKHDMGYCD